MAAVTSFWKRSFGSKSYICESWIQAITKASLSQEHSCWPGRWDRHRSCCKTLWLNVDLIRSHVVFSVWKFYLPFSPSQLHTGENNTTNYEYQHNTRDNIDNLSLNNRRRWSRKGGFLPRGWCVCGGTWERSCKRYRYNMTVLKRRELKKWDGEFRVYFLPPLHFLQH